MTIRRVTAREFQKRFQRYEEPVLVNEGIFFPKIDVELHDHAETLSTSLDQSSSGQSTSSDTSPTPSRDLSKKAQSKGKMAR